MGHLWRRFLSSHVRPDRIRQSAVLYIEPTGLGQDGIASLSWEVRLEQKHRLHLHCLVDIPDESG